MGGWGPARWILSRCGARAAHGNGRRAFHALRARIAGPTAKPDATKQKIGADVEPIPSHRRPDRQARCDPPKW